MTLPGGASDKLGNRYEGRWTVRCILRILEEGADSIHLEPPGADGEGVEFWLRTGDIRDYHQVKRQVTGRGRWSLSLLKSEGVLAAFRSKLQSPNTECTFVSTQAADQLMELASRAKKSSGYAAFRTEFLAAGEWRKQFSTLKVHWDDCPDVEAYEALKRINVRTQDEDSLREEVLFRLSVLIDGDPQTLATVLADFALDRVSTEVTAHDIWTHLESLPSGFRRRNWANDTRVHAQAADSVNRYLNSFDAPTIGGRVIPRDEVETALQMLHDPAGKRALLLTGEGGGGKSGVMLQVVSRLKAEGVPIVALRLDRLPATLLSSEVGRELGLPGSPASVLAAIAHSRECVLVIDQLDAVSLASGRQAGFFDCVKEILIQAQIEPSMRVVMACRKFDFENDYRLRGLTADGGIATELPIPHLTAAAVREEVAALGFDAAQLTARQVQLLAIPLHLSILAETARATDDRLLDFHTAKDLYDQYWRRKQTHIRDRRGSPITNWAHIIGRLCDYMSSRQVLIAPRYSLDEYGEEDVASMISEHVLVEDGSNLAFFHQSFFDYAFARGFLSRGGDIVGLLRSGEQHLFRRAQVRQILVYERDSEFSQYLGDLRVILADSDIRFHIKSVALAFLEDIQDPREDEWGVLSALIQDDESPLSARVWSVLRRSPSWQTLLDRLGLIERWLCGDDQRRVDQAVTLLRSAQGALGDRVAALLEPHTNDPGWRDRLRWLMQQCDLHRNRNFLDLFLRLMDAGVLDDVRDVTAANGDFWLLIYQLAERRPDWASEVIGHYLARRLDLSRAAGVANPFDNRSGNVGSSSFAAGVIGQSADRAPEVFVRQIFPFVLQVLADTAVREGNPPWTDPVWYFRTRGELYSIDDVLLSKLEDAIAALGEDSALLENLVDQLAQSTFETAEYLLIRLYTAHGRRFADRAAEYLCDDSRRLAIGYIDGVHWAARELVGAIILHVSAERLANLQRLLLDYYPSSERGVQGRRRRGYAQLTILGGVDTADRTPAMVQRLQQLERRFPQVSPEEPQGVRGGRVRSPVPGTARTKMSDEQWLTAIAAYNVEETRYRRGDDVVGGARQLASLMQSQVNDEPLRFASLANRLPDQTHPAYFDAILDGVTASQTRIDVEPFSELMRRCHRLPDRPSAQTMVRAVAAYRTLSLPDDVIDILIWCANDHPDPDREEWRTSADDAQSPYGGDPFTAGLNSVRGAAACALADVIFADPARLLRLSTSLERLVAEPLISVRSCIAAILVAVLGQDRALAVDLFSRLCQVDDDALLGTRFIERFLYFALATDFEALQPILERMLDSSNPAAAIAGARQASLVALTMEEARALAFRCIEGTENQRQGAAEVFSANLKTAAFRATCEEALIRLFNDPNDKVRSKAASCFRRLEGREFGEFVGLAESFIASSAYETERFPLIQALEKTTSDASSIICMAADKFLDLVGTDAGNFSTSSAGDSHEFSELVIRAYGQTSSEAVRSRCLDVLDRMMALQAYGVAEALDSFER